MGHLGERIVDQYGDGSRWGMRIEYTFDGPRLLGTGGALIQGLPRLGDAFYVLFGDSYLPVDYRAVGNAYLQSGRPDLITAYENQGHHDTCNVWFEGREIRVYD